jgi:thiol:disulfide interchange protein DsbD
MQMTMKTIFYLVLSLFLSTASAGPNLLESLGLSDSEPVPPSVDEAFVFSAEASSNELVASWYIAEGNYLYKDKISFEVNSDSGISLKSYQLPEGENKQDEIFGLTEVFHHDVQVELPFFNPLQASQITLTAHYQGCSETFNICYPPTIKTINLDIPANVATKSEENVPTQKLTSIVSEQDKFANTLANDSLFTIVLSFLGLGVLLAFTPCVFPMIPILSSIILGQGSEITTRRAFVLSLTYVLAMSVTYTIAGIITGLLGANLQAMMQNPWVIGSFSALFVLFALSMFGLFELQLPHFMQNRLHQIGQKQQGGTLVGVAIMGLLSGLIVGPCLAPPLAGALIFIGQHGDPILGGVALFSLSMGMGLPLLAIGTSGGSLLPKAGLWMDTIKAIFGVFMLALAIWMLERIIPGWIAMWLWASLFIVVAIFIGAFTSIQNDATGWQKLCKGLGLLLFIYGTTLFIGGASGNQNIWQPLQHFQASVVQATEKQHLNFTSVNNLDELNQVLRHTSQPVLVDFYADWCIDCKKMEVTTFSDPVVIERLASWKTIQVDVTDNNEQHQALAREFGVFGPPTILFFDANGIENKQFRLVGGVSSKELLNHLDQEALR